MILCGTEMIRFYQKMTPELFASSAEINVHGNISAIKLAKLQRFVYFPQNPALILEVIS